MKNLLFLSAIIVLFYAIIGFMKNRDITKQPKQKILKGTLMTLFAGIAWGMSGASGQYLMAHGMGVLALTDLRLIISGTLLLLMSYLFNRD